MANRSTSHLMNIDYNSYLQQFLGTTRSPVLANILYLSVLIVVLEWDILPLVYHNEAFVVSFKLHVVITEVTYCIILVPCYY